MKEIDTQQIIAYDKNIQEVVVRKRRKKIMGKFSAISQLSSLSEPRNDIFDVLTQVSKGAFNLFNEFKTHRDDQTNLVTYSTQAFKKTHRETFSRNLKELRKVNLVKVAMKTMTGMDARRPYVSPKQTYMLNPDLLKCWNYDDAQLLWGQCKA